MSNKCQFSRYKLTLNWQGMKEYNKNGKKTAIVMEVKIKFIYNIQISDIKMQDYKITEISILKQLTKLIK